MMYINFLPSNIIKRKKEKEKIKESVLNEILACSIMNQKVLFHELQHKQFCI